MNKQNGIVIGIVTSLEDPENIGRIQVSYPYLNDEHSDWAPVVSFMAGPDRGARFIPEVDDEVLLAFEQGESRKPYVLGGVWSKKDTPPPHDGSAVNNNWRYIKSRSGHILRFDDTGGGEKIEVIDKDDKHKIIIDTSGDKIDIVCDSGDIRIFAQSGTVEVSATDIKMTASGNIDMEAGGNVTIKGTKIDLN